MDESGSRNPGNQNDPSRVGRDWFGLGGYIIHSDDEDEAKEKYKTFVDRWNIRCPLHLTDMLSYRKNWGWLGNKPAEELEWFWHEYRNFLASLPVVGMACVIDRPGYRARGYLERYPDTKWQLCRSAFDISIERAAKYARMRELKLDVIFESDPAYNDLMKRYFKNLKLNGLSFSATNSEKYGPLSKNEFSEILGTIEYKNKQSRMLQMADSYIYTICRGKYDHKFLLYRRLRDARRIMNFALDGDGDKIRAMGVKYYCFD